MSFAGNPRKYARDIADGYVLVTPVILRPLVAPDLRAIKQAIELELRDSRATVPPADDLSALQAKQRRILRLNQALQVIRTYALKRRLPI
jgi:hypothetical protein